MDEEKINEQPLEQPEEQTEEQTETDLVANITAAYEEKLATQKASYEARIKERDRVIKQLINEEKDEPSPTDGIVEKVNSRRIFKKW